MRPSPYESMSSRAKSIEGNPFGKMACGFGYRGGRGTVGKGGTRSENWPAGST